MSNELKAPFPWFGGKSRAAEIIWARFGDVPNYSEPFAGSLAVLLRRPHAPGNEIINDLDCYVANAWRAIQAAPEEVAAHCDWPVNEADLHARHRWLHGRAEFRLRMETDPDYFDAKIAAWWIWGLSCWIGDNFCRPKEQDSPPALWKSKVVARPLVDRRRPHVTGGQVVARKVPHLTGGKGVARQVPCGTYQPQLGGAGSLSDSATAESLERVGAGRGPDGKLDDVTESAAPDGREGRGPASGIPRQIPNITGTLNAKTHHGAPMGKGVAKYQTEALREWFYAIADRLRFTKVCCGDWSRVVTKAATFGQGATAVLLDPPYSRDVRDPNIYANEVDGLSDRVREWAIANGENPLLRIALCGYEGEHRMPATWECVPWKAAGGYANRNTENLNATLERVWFSPHCLRPELSLFDQAEGAA